ncbi:MAG: hypothetical protein ACRDZY_06340, partial [Acidimicrobiales bacterium]
MTETPPVTEPETATKTKATKANGAPPPAPEAEAVETPVGELEGDVTLKALHHIQHDDTHHHPGDEFTVPAAAAADMIAARTAVVADQEDAERQLKQANAARARALHEAGILPATASQHRRAEDPPGPTFDTTQY